MATDREHAERVAAWLEGPQPCSGCTRCDAAALIRALLAEQDQLVGIVQAVERLAAEIETAASGFAGQHFPHVQVRWRIAAELRRILEAPPLAVLRGEEV